MLDYRQDHFHGDRCISCHLLNHTDQREQRWFRCCKCQFEGHVECSVARPTKLPFYTQVFCVYCDAEGIDG